ncbi:translational GTPase TypA [Sulfobacillus thermosulfidooxidans]|uniref:Large ribosomal subunit assembly factor BipA n=1 Tax=Sulfobacillus thermosulfidooxidans (strain DSM 9293 / VKM B-1269 / AT-1) TaxID=929705 RepID=A0A1W1WMP9_SULTA|nr:translational GTPase TypA [Sulfobacillus thermosulfidooxidans]OLZ09764.1 GTP-binding protein TypA [Sulfobacillus thermosulfidooxidans]OLZ15929.1 GTP-binding protein TypA [Sulfobacillus thermosulfidooxidans]OLZ18223.1 GTP-binding protein TypA [Sulfobacillus thermosulfidooxidans]SMC07584.1 GTP-binding protein [Sulfobacillus thermosulfidooxidans DSM 9293]
MERRDIRNIAIIAHVDHGKTTLVDAMLRQSGIFRDPSQMTDRVLDSNDLERERGITILSKTTAIRYHDTTINIVDTPGHADFGGEVERILSMVDGALLVVDANEGPMPQTRYVLQKALSAGIKPIVVLNKMDREGARPHEVVDQVLELFIDLEASDDQLEFPVLYASAKQGVASVEPVLPESGSLEPLFETILREIPFPVGDETAPLQILVTTLEHDDYLGRMAIGRVTQGRVAVNQTVGIVDHDGAVRRARLSKIFGRIGLKRVELETATVGDIVTLAGLPDVNIGETITDADNPMPLPPIVVDEPTLTILIGVNTSPFAGQEGQFVTSRHLRERLLREQERNVALKVEETEDAEVFRVSGRGELHLGILLEQMRREGYEMEVSKPEVIMHKTPEGLMEPVEHLYLDVPDEYVGPVMELLGPRKAEMLHMGQAGPNQTRLEFLIPARGLLGFRTAFVNQTRGYGIMNHLFEGYQPYSGPIEETPRGALIAIEDGVTTSYALDNAQQRGILFVGPGTPVYAGMVVGENSRPTDLELNVCKKKHVTNMRSSTSDEAVRLTPPRPLTLDLALEYVKSDELVEITPKSIRLRKATLDKTLRKREKIQKL